VAVITTTQYKSKLESMKVTIKDLRMREADLLKEVTLLTTQVNKPIEGSMLINRKEYNVGDILKQFGDNVYNDEIDRIKDMCAYYLCNKCKHVFNRYLESRKRKVDSDVKKALSIST